MAQTVKNLSTMQEIWAQSLGWEDLLEKGMATHSSILAWRIPWMEEPGELQSIGSQRVGHDWVTFTSGSRSNTLYMYWLKLSGPKFPKWKEWKRPREGRQDVSTVTDPSKSFWVCKKATGRQSLPYFFCSPSLEMKATCVAAGKVKAKYTGKTQA